jgi:hypothetical protein
MGAAMSDTEKVRLYAVTALRNFKGDDVKRLLIYRIVSDTSPEVICAAIDSLKAFADEQDTSGSDSIVETLKAVMRAGYTEKAKKRARELLLQLGIEMPDDPFALDGDLRQ